MRAKCHPHQPKTMRAILPVTSRWIGPAERRARAALEEAAGQTTPGFARPRPAPEALFAQLGSLFAAEEMGELMRALDG